MKLLIKVQMLDGSAARVAAVAFEAWDAPEPERTWLTNVAAAEAKDPQREVSCMLALLREHALTPELIVIDGFVHLDAQETPGPGLLLHQALDKRTAVIGVSKTARPGLPGQFEVMREEETKPLIVTCAGIDLGAAKVRLRAMHGRKRIPTLLKLVARLARNADSP